MAQQPGFDFFGFGNRLGDESEVRAKFWRTAKKAARQIPFMEEVVAAYYCALDKKTPLRAKGILLAALGYFVMPIDIIPDFFAVIGFSDDAAVLALAFSMIKGHIRQEHYDAADRALANEPEAAKTV